MFLFSSNLSIATCSGCCVRFSRSDGTGAESRVNTCYVSHVVWPKPNACAQPYQVRSGRGNGAPEVVKSMICSQK